MKYNQFKHINLLKKEKILIKESKNKLTDEYTELLNYQILMISHLHWENRLEYFSLIEEILDGSIQIFDLLQKDRAIRKECERLELELESIVFEPDPRSEGFGAMIDQILSVLEAYCPDPDDCEDYELSENRVREIISEIFLQMTNSYS